MFPRQRTLTELRDDVLGEGACITTPFGERRLTYADYIASGRPLASVEEALRTAVLPLYANTHTEDSASGAATTTLVHEAAEYVKRCLGADASYKLLFPGTGATGALKRLQEILGVSVPGHLRQLVLDRLDPTDRMVVFVGPYEHHSNEVSWRESLAEVVTVPLDSDGLIDMPALERALSDPRYAGRPKLGTFSAASNVTGLLTDVRAVAGLLHRHGAIAVFDYAASAPYVPIDVSRSSPDADDWLDAIVLSPHKFLGGPGAAGLLLFRSDLYRLSSPTTAGGGTVTYVSHTQHRFVHDIEAREDAGTPGILQKLRAALAFRVKEQLGTDVIEARERELIGRAVSRLSGRPGIRILGNKDAPRLAVMSFLVSSGGKQLHARFVIRLLSDLFGIQGRAGCSCAGPYGHDLLGIGEEVSACYLNAIEAGYEGVKPGWARVSFHYLCDDEEVEYLLSAIEFIAEHGHLFLPLYKFCWRGGSWTHRGVASGGHHAFEPESWTPVRACTRPRGEDYAAYLNEARDLAERLARGETPGVAETVDATEAPPADLDPQLLWFVR